MPRAIKGVPFGPITWPLDVVNAPVAAAELVDVVPDKMRSRFCERGAAYLHQGNVWNKKMVS
jgi:hypothetical protein